MSDDTITIKRSTYRKIQVALVVVLVAFAFTGGFFLGSSGKTTNQAIGQQLQQQQQQGQQQQQNAPGTKVNVPVGDSPVRGDPGAKVTIVEFSDFQCPFCGRFFTETLSQIEKDYISTGKVKIAYKHFPLGFHQNAQKAAEASECAKEQGKFWEYHDTLFLKQNEWSSTDGVTSFKQYASDIGLNANQFNSCLDSGKYASVVSRDVQSGASAGVDGTPTFFINGQPIVGAQPYSAFKQIIDQELSA